MADLGPGRKGSELRQSSRARLTDGHKMRSMVRSPCWQATPAGLVRATGDDGKPRVAIPDLPRQKLGTCTFRAETTIITIAQRMPVRGLLTDTGIAFENNQEHLALSALLDRLGSAARQSGGDAPAPEAEHVPNLGTTVGVFSGNDHTPGWTPNDCGKTKVYGKRPQKNSQPPTELEPS